MVSSIPKRIAPYGWAIRGIRTLVDQRHQSVDRKVRLLGTDSSGFVVRGVAHHPNHTLVAHAAAVLQCLRNLGVITHQHFYLIALPLPVKGLDACPVRASAVEQV
jgi:kynurenine formamidase